MLVVLGFNFLGIIIDECINWNAHVDKIANKISRNLGLLSKPKQFLPTAILKTLYDTLILCRLCYAITSWGCNLNRLTKLQKRQYVL